MLAFCLINFTNFNIFPPGIDNHQFDNFHEIKKDDWVMRNTTLHYEHPKQNGVLLTIGEADAQMDYYNFLPPPAHAEDYDSDQGTIPSANMTMPPPPLEIHFADFDGRDGIQVEMFPQYVEYMMRKENAFENEYRVSVLAFRTTFQLYPINSGAAALIIYKSRSRVAQ